MSCAEPSPEDLDEQEITFLEDIHQLMQAAHFRLLSADDWKTAQAEQFTVSLPNASAPPVTYCTGVARCAGISALAQKEERRASPSRKHIMTQELCGKAKLKEACWQRCRGSMVCMDPMYTQRHQSPSTSRPAFAVPAQFNSPVEVNWEYMDRELMQRYWANHEAERAGTAPISDRILVFHRGISTVRPCRPVHSPRDLHLLCMTLNKEQAWPPSPAGRVCSEKKMGSGLIRQKTALCINPSPLLLAPGKPAIGFF